MRLTGTGRTPCVDLFPHTISFCDTSMLKQAIRCWDRKRDTGFGDRTPTVQTEGTDDMSKPKAGRVTVDLADQKVRPVDRRRLEQDAERDAERSKRRGGKIVLGAPATDAEIELLGDSNSEQ